MKNLKLSDKLLIVVAGLFIGIFISISVVVLATDGSIDNIFTQQNDFEKLKPGEASTKDVIKLKGEPVSIEENGDSTSLLYNTKSEDYKNSVIIENDKVKYSVENVFDSSRGKLSDYKRKHGEPDLKMYDPFDEIIAYYIFLEGGVGISTFNDEEIVKIIYFSPQNKEEFIKNVATPLKLGFDKPEHNLE